MRNFRTRAVLALLALIALGAAGCASSQGARDLPDERSGIGTVTIDAVSSRFDIRVMEDVTRARDTVNAIVEEVWNLVPEAYVQLGVPIAGVNPEARLLGNNGFRAEGNFGDVRLSELVNCGRTMTGDIADEYDLRFEVMTQVHDAEGRSVVTSVVQATARPRGVSGNAVRCSSTGKLEREIVKRVRTELVGIE